VPVSVSCVGPPPHSHRYSEFVSGRATGVRVGAGRWSVPPPTRSLWVRPAAFMANKPPRSSAKHPQRRAPREGAASPSPAQRPVPSAAVPVPSAAAPQRSGAQRSGACAAVPVMVSLCAPVATRARRRPVHSRRSLIRLSSTDTSPAATIGSRIRIAGEWRIIIGTVGAVRHSRLDGEPGPTIDLPFQQRTVVPHQATFAPISHPLTDDPLSR
jgi:hypothetical protein